MNWRPLKLRWWLVSASILLIIGFFALQAWKRFMVARITLREAYATVTAKEYVRFDETNHSYVDDRGNQIDVPPGQEQWRVYYRIDDFGNADEHVRTDLLNAESERVAAGRLRFRGEDKEWYDSVKAGDKLKVLYQWHGGNTIYVEYIESQERAK